MSYPAHLQRRLSRELERLIALSFPHLARRALRRGLHQVWLQGDFGRLPDGPFILASNHHSWWDLYLAWEVRQRLARPLVALMQEETLGRFPFFQHLGVVSRRKPRSALRRLKEGWVLQLFPEGEMRQAGRVEKVEGGLEFFARRSQAPVIPLAIRVVLRGAERPEAFLVLGPVLQGDEAVAERFATAINSLLGELDAALLAWHPEALPPGFASWFPTSRRFDERVASLGRLWRR